MSVLLSAVFRDYLIFTQAVSNTGICFLKPKLRLMRYKKNQKNNVSEE
jgi:hypothetical protein